MYVLLNRRQGLLLLPFALFSSSLDDLSKRSKRTLHKPRVQVLAVDKVLLIPLAELHGFDVINQAVLVCMGEKWTSCSSSVRKNVMYTLSLLIWHSTLPWLHPFSVFPYVCIETRCFRPWVTSHLFGRAESSRQIRSADICRSMTTSPLTNYASMVSMAV